MIFFLTGKMDLFSAETVRVSKGR